MNFSKIFTDGEKITIPAKAFMQLAYEAFCYDMIVRLITNASDPDRYDVWAKIGAAFGDPMAPIPENRGDNA